MRNLPLGILWVCLISIAAPVPAQTESEIDILRAELAQMRADYAARIAQLEKRLDAAEKQTDKQQAPQPELEPDTSKGLGCFEKKLKSGWMLLRLHDDAVELFSIHQFDHYIYPINDEFAYIQRGYPGYLHRPF